MTVFTLKLNLSATASISVRAALAFSHRHNEKTHFGYERNTIKKIDKEHTFNLLLLIQGGYLDFGFSDRSKIDDTRWLSGGDDFLFEHIYQISAQLTGNASLQNVTKMPPGK